MEVGRAMANISMKGAEINEILKKTINAIEEGRQEVFEILEVIRNECNILKEELEQLQNRIKLLIEEVETLESKENVSKRILSRVSSEFSIYTEEDIKTAYENANDIRVKLALKRHEERTLIKERTDLELRLKNAQDILRRAESLMSKIGAAFDFLSGDLEGITDTLENINQRSMLGKKIIQAQEEERQRIAMDIHDGPAQSLTNAVIKTEVCERMLDMDTDGAKIEIQELKVILRDSIKDMRKIIYNLRPMALDDVGLIPTIERYINSFQNDTNIKVNFIIISQMDIDDKIKKAALFRIVQEALNNVQKHSGATEVKIKMELTTKNLFLIIKDNGVGFDTEKLKIGGSPDSGFGLFNMKERVELLNGKLEIKSKSNYGTKIIVNIPNEN